VSESSAEEKAEKGTVRTFLSVTPAVHAERALKRNAASRHRASYLV
jgi:hypothetical protein